MNPDSQLKHTLINGDSRRMGLVNDESVHLIVTSPPYWQLKDYGVEGQIGYNDSYEQYINKLNLVWLECFRVLKPGCRLCINIGDQFARAAYYGRYKVVPIHSEIIKFCETIGFDYMGNIIWQKPTSMHTTGGGKMMGSYPYPRGGIIKVDYENILIFKKPGKCGAMNNEARWESKLSDEEWNTYFCSHWTFPGDRQHKHIAVFPEELPARLIKMFSFKNDTVLDPFMGSGTTALAALRNQRSAIGYELNKDFFLYYREKIFSVFPETQVPFNLKKDDSILNLDALGIQLPYKFKDYIKIDRDEEAAKETYGSTIRDNKINDSLKQIESYKGIEETLGGGPTVLIDHVDEEPRKIMIEKGICYLRIGDVKGSLTVTPGFANLSYLLLHSSGQNPKMFRLKQKGSFQIWTKETLTALGFHPTSSPYYAVIRFNTSEIKINRLPNLKAGKATYIAKILPYSEFI